MRYKVKRLVLFMLFWPIAVSQFAQEAIPQLAKKILPSTVTIYAYDKNGNAFSQGSGFFIDNLGTIVTNRHVLEDAFSAEAKTYSGDKLEITHILAEDPNTDIITVKSKIKSSTVTFLKISQKQPEVGEKILAVGSPKGYEGSISDGIISSKRELERFGNVFQTTTAISSGSSGGPLINMNGEVIGIITFQVKDGQSLNFALPAERIGRLARKQPLSLQEWSIANNNQNAEQHLRDGNRYYYNANYAEAIKCYEQYLGLKQNNAIAWLNIGDCYYLLGIYDNTIKAASKAIEIDKDEEYGYFLRAMAKEKILDTYGALLDYSTAISLNPKNAGYYCLRAYTKDQLNDKEGALKDYDMAIQLKPTDDEFFQQRGYLKSRIEDYKGAMEDYNKAIQLNPSNSFNYYHRGILKLILNDKIGGCMDLSKAGELGDQEVYKTIREYCQ